MQAGAVPAIIALSVGGGVEVALQRRCAAALCNLACTPANIARMVEVGGRSTTAYTTRTSGMNTISTSYVNCCGSAWCRLGTAVTRRISASVGITPPRPPVCHLPPLIVYLSTGRGDPKHHPPPQDRGYPMCQGGSKRNLYTLNR